MIISLLGIIAIFFVYFILSGTMRDYHGKTALKEEELAKKVEELKIQHTEELRVLRIQDSILVASYDSLYRATAKIEKRLKEGRDAADKWKDLDKSNTYVLPKPN